MNYLPAMMLYDIPAEACWWITLMYYRLFVNSGDGIWVYAREVRENFDGKRVVDRAIRLVRPEWRS